MMLKYLLLLTAGSFWLVSCSNQKKTDTQQNSATTADETTVPLHQRLNQYEEVSLTTDLNKLSAKERQMVPLLISVAKIMDDIFWYEAYGQRDSLLQVIRDGATRKFVHINYGPWDRLDNNTPFIKGVGPKPEGANFYPPDMTRAEFEKAALKDKKSPYTLLRRDQNHNLITVPYHVQFKPQVTQAADLLRRAAGLADDAGLKKYLTLRAEALLTDNYQPSDLAWMDMKNNTIDFVVGPIEVYEDKLFNYKAAHEAYVLIKDQEWSKKLARYAAFLPELQRSLPVPAKYKQEKPGTDSDLNAYDVVYYAGDCNAGSKTIAINLPNDEEVQLKKGTRRLQLKNALQAKFDKIMQPIANTLIAEDQRQHVTFDAFFATTMFHEVAHGLGIKNLVNGQGTIRDALKEQGSALEEGKADILGLYMINQLHRKGEIQGNMQDYYTTFLAGIFRSVRFGAASAHGQANMVRFNFFAEKGAFERDARTNTYRVNYPKMEQAMNQLSEKILTLQGNGDYNGVNQMLAEQGKIDKHLQADLDRLSRANIPVDVVFDQGLTVLGL